MNIGTILFAMEDEGGIFTVKNELSVGLKANGHKVSEYFISLNTKKFKQRPGFDKTMGFMQPEMVSDFKRTVEKHDVLIFVQPCPTITKAFNSKKWMELYKTGKPNLVIAHDPLMEGHYPWFEEVKPYVNGINCVQESAYRIISKYFDPSIMISKNYFLDMNGSGLFD